MINDVWIRPFSSSERSHSSPIAVSTPVNWKSVSKVLIRFWGLNKNPSQKVLNTNLDAKDNCYLMAYNIFLQYFIKIICVWSRVFNYSVDTVSSLRQHSFWMYFFSFCVFVVLWSNKRNIDAQWEIGRRKPISYYDRYEIAYSNLAKKRFLIKFWNRERLLNYLERNIQICGWKPLNHVIYEVNWDTNIDDGAQM